MGHSLCKHPDSGLQCPPSLCLHEGEGAQHPSGPALRPLLQLTSCPGWEQGLNRQIWPLEGQRHGCPRSDISLQGRASRVKLPLVPVLHQKRLNASGTGEIWVKESKHPPR